MSERDRGSPRQEPATPGDVAGPILELRNVSVEFQMERGTSRVVDEVSLAIEEEEMVGIIGESGSGKSMLASSILDAVEEPGITSGQVIYHPEDGEPFDVLELTPEEMANYRWREVSMVFQGAMSSFNPTMRIGEHFEETIERHNVPRSEGLDRAHQLLRDVHLDPERVMRAYAHELSGGMRQRALLALSLVLDPKVVIMDEPTAALDLLMQRAILQLLADLRETYDLTIIFITHDLPLITNLADRMAVMYAFELIEIGSTMEILTNSAHPYTRALLKATPSLETVTEEMEAIPGRSPDPVNPPSGCSYHPRCPMARPVCEIEEPPFSDVGDGHTSACLFAEQVEDTIPLEGFWESETA